MKISVARFRCRHPECATNGSVQKDFSMSTLYEHIGMHLSLDTAKREHMNLICSCSPEFCFMGAPYALDHLDKVQRNPNGHMIQCRMISIQDKDTCGELLSYFKRFVGFSHYAIEEDTAFHLPVLPMMEQLPPHYGHNASPMMQYHNPGHNMQFYHQPLHCSTPNPHVRQNGFAPVFTTGNAQHLYPAPTKGIHNGFSDLKSFEDDGFDMNAGASQHQPMVQGNGFAPMITNGMNMIESPAEDNEWSSVNEVGSRAPNSGMSIARVRTPVYTRTSPERAPSFLSRGNTRLMPPSRNSGSTPSLHALNESCRSNARSNREQFIEQGGEIGDYVMQRRQGRPRGRGSFGRVRGGLMQPRGRPMPDVITLDNGRPFCDFDVDTSADSATRNCFAEPPAVQRRRPTPNDGAEKQQLAVPAKTSRKDLANVTVRSDSD